MKITKNRYVTWVHNENKKTHFFAVYTNVHWVSAALRLDLVGVRSV